MKVVRKNGFTLIEMLLVLMIISVFTALSIPHIEKVAEVKRENYMIEQLTEDILYAQQYAMAYKTAVQVIFDQGQAHYHIIEMGERQRVLIERSLPDKWIFELATLQMPLAFLANGNVNKAGTVFIKNNTRGYKIVFLLGKGRFYVQKM